MPIELDPDTVVSRGQSRYEREIRAAVEPDHTGDYLALDVDTGAYEVDADDATALQKLKARIPDAVIYLLRVGYPSAYRLGGGFQVPDA